LKQTVVGKHALGLLFVGRSCSVVNVTALLLLQPEPLERLEA